MFRTSDAAADHEPGNTGAFDTVATSPSHRRPRDHCASVFAALDGDGDVLEHYRIDLRPRGFGMGQSEPVGASTTSTQAAVASTQSVARRGMRPGPS
jgi:hypothetical protein